MSRLISLRLAISVVLASAVLPAAAFAQSQDTQSVAEAARRAREQKKAAAKPATVITNDDVKPATPAATEPASPSATTNSLSGEAAADSSTSDPKDEKTAKEIADLKEQIKQAQSDFDLAQRQLSLEQDTYFSNPDYTRATAQKAKVDGLKQQVSDKQQTLDTLRARLAQLQPVPPPPAPAAAPKP
jgi:predicted RNase H-like nuclease (RuvC/YqgF family)